MLDGWIDMRAAPLNIDFINVDLLTDLILGVRKKGNGRFLL